MTNTYHRVGNGPHSVLVLHGWFGDAHSFEEIEPWLNTRAFSYVFMDYRGYGGMQAVHGAYTIDEIASDALALADALGIHEFSLIGHSMGGMAISGLPRWRPTGCGHSLLLRRFPAVAFRTMLRHAACLKMQPDNRTTAKPS
ncbi:TPA: alpha/beta hydrolase [Morganella morganii]|nr:alpha/beta hydrolase [Morganella morganii]